MTKTEARRHLFRAHLAWQRSLLGRDAETPAPSGQKVQRKPDWRVAERCRRCADEGPVQAPSVDRSVDISLPPSPRAGSISFRSRRCVIEPEAMISLRGVLMAIIIIIGLPLAIVRCCSAAEIGAQHAHRLRLNWTMTDEPRAAVRSLSH